MRNYLTGILILTNVVTVYLLLHEWQADRVWKLEMHGMASYAATIQADADFSAGIRRQFNSVPDEPTAKFTGQYDGPFQIWTKPFYPVMGEGHIYAEQQFVQMYNLIMKELYAHPDRVAELGATAVKPATAPAATQGS